MQLSSLPARISAIFAASAAPTSKNVIPLTQAGTTQPAQASFDVGFPAITMQPAASGGISPYGQDFNGLGNVLTAVQQWQSAGGLFTFDATFASTVGGYPKGALLLKSGGNGFWQSTADNNTNNPDTGGANWNDLIGQSSGVVGHIRNAKMAVATASASATFTADEIVLETALGGSPWRLAGFNKTINLATTGAGGMDTGTAPVSGYVALYAIYNPTTSTASILATNAATLQGNVYGGANMPSGYTFSALIGVWPTNASSQFKTGLQVDRLVQVASVSVLSSSTAQASWTSLGISSAVPLNAKTCSGYLTVGNTGGTSAGIGVIVASDANGSGYQIMSGYCTSGSGTLAIFTALAMAAAQTIYYETNGALLGATYSINVSGYTF